MKGVLANYQEATISLKRKTQLQNKEILRLRNLLAKNHIDDPMRPQGHDDGGVLD